MSEVYTTITGYSRYEISNTGKVRAKEKIVKSRFGFRKATSKYISLSITSQGYHRVHLKGDDGIVKPMFVHRIVALMFIPNVDDKPYINHIDGNPANNIVDNLEWCTQYENIHHAINTGLSPKRPAAKFNNTTLEEVRQALSNPHRGIINELAEKYGVDRHTITNIKNNKYYE